MEGDSGSGQDKSKDLARVLTPLASVPGLSQEGGPYLALSLGCHET